MYSTSLLHTLAVPCEVAEGGDFCGGRGGYERRKEKVKESFSRILRKDESHLLTRRWLRYKWTRNTAREFLEARQRALHLLVARAVSGQKSLPVAHLVATGGTQKVRFAAFEVERDRVGMAGDLFTGMYAPTVGEMDAALGNRLRLQGGTSGFN